MRIRGQIYWDWADPELHCRSHEDRLNGGVLMDVQVRLSSTGDTQIFIGVYGEQGAMLFEEAYYDRNGETMTHAMDWGIQRAKELVATLNAPKPEPLPRKGPRQSE